MCRDRATLHFAPDPTCVGRICHSCYLCAGYSHSLFDWFFFFLVIGIFLWNGGDKIKAVSKIALNFKNIQNTKPDSYPPLYSSILILPFLTQWRVFFSWFWTLKLWPSMLSNFLFIFQVFFLTNLTILKDFLIRSFQIFFPEYRRQSINRVFTKSLSVHNVIIIALPCINMVKHWIITCKRNTHLTILVELIISTWNFWSSRTKCICTRVF